MQLRQGLATWRVIGGELALPYILARLAEAYGKAGQATDGLHVLDEAQRIMHKTGECHYEAEVYRLKGELLVQRFADRSGWQTISTEIETCFCQALDVARRQQAKSLELRTAMSLVRLWQQQGKQAEAYALLAPIYGWFTEGFATADLQEARTLLEELAGCV